MLMLFSQRHTDTRQRYKALVLLAYHGKLPSSVLSAETGTKVIFSFGSNLHFMNGFRRLCMAGATTNWYETGAKCH